MPLLTRTFFALAFTAALGTAPTAQAHGQPEASAASSLSLSLPVAVVASAPAAVLSTAGLLTVVAVQASATGAVWVLERASDGTRVVLRLSGAGLQASALAVGATVAVTVLSAGALISAGSAVLCFVPNAIGMSLLHNEQITF